MRFEDFSPEEQDHAIRELLGMQAPEEPAGTLADWIGSGVGTMSYGPGYDPDEPAFAPEDWEAFREEKKGGVRKYVFRGLGLGFGGSCVFLIRS
jgi:hypothetical protein